MLCALRHLREHAAVDFFPDVRLKGHVMFQELVNFIEIVSVRAVKFLYEILAVLHAVSEHDVRRIMMRTHEIQRQTVFAAEPQHVGNMRIVGGRGTADAQGGIDLFDGRGRNAIELVIVVHVPAPKSSAGKTVFSVEVGLVPDFKVPGTHFFASVTVDQVFDKFFDKPHP